ncbi:MAG: hypothetical protein GKR91_02550 [Pseudomonadales bacterium]|nr:hypothetical protein [Pseudomonadales bacterium]
MDSAPNDRAKIWQDILISSQQMEEVAQKNEWQKLTRLIASRQKLLNQFFSEPVARNQVRNLEKIRADIKIILEHDERTRKLSEANNSTLLKGIRALNKGKLAAKSYQ